MHDRLRSNSRWISRTAACLQRVADQRSSWSLATRSTGGIRMSGAATTSARAGSLVATALTVLAVGTMGAMRAMGAAGAAGEPAAAQELVTLDRAAIKALPSATSPLKITSLPLLQPGGDVVAVRVSLPAGTDIAPHPHPAGKTAVVTVLSGDIEIGLGAAFNEAALKRVAPGEVVVLRDTDPHHFARTGSAPVELLLIAAPKGAVSPALLGTREPGRRSGSRQSPNPTDC